MSTGHALLWIGSDLTVSNASNLRIVNILFEPILYSMLIMHGAFPYGCVRSIAYIPVAGSQASFLAAMPSNAEI